LMCSIWHAQMLKWLVSLTKLGSFSNKLNPWNCASLLHFPANAFWTKVK
jgi:hypothetical protein